MAEKPPTTSLRSNVRPHDLITPPQTPEKVVEISNEDVSPCLDDARRREKRGENLTYGVAIGQQECSKKSTQAVSHALNADAMLDPLPGIPDSARRYQGSYQLHEQIGYGAWSHVYRASELTPKIDVGPQVHPPLTPPSSPGTSERASTTLRLAVKTVARRDGKLVLEKEARILTYLHSQSESSRYLVPFYGNEPASCSIVMACIQPTLEDHAQQAAKVPLTTATMFEPVVGVQEWYQLALDLISGLVFLKGCGCIHGDIKPANVLLQPSEGNQAGHVLRPLYCDFSSSHIITPKLALKEIEEISAVTTEYTAPELIRAFRPRRHEVNNDRAVATFASDVFSLGVTLLFAATGQSPYNQAAIQFQKIAMAEEGEPMQYAQAGSQASRVLPEQGVHSLLNRAFAKSNQRIHADTWEVMAIEAVRSRTGSGS